MSTSIFIRAIKPANEHHQKMMNLYKICKDLNLSLPDEAYKYFGDGERSEFGVTIDHYELPIECREEYYKESESGYRIDLDKLPKDVRYLEVYLS